MVNLATDLMIEDGDTRAAHRLLDILGAAIETELTNWNPTTAN